MKNVLLLFVTLLLFACSSSEERTEEKIMECMYMAYDDDGVAFKQAMTDFEAELIQKEILTQGTGKGYRSLFQKLGSDEDMKLNTSLSFTELTAGIGRPNIESFQACQNELKNIEEQSTKSVRLQQVLDSLSMTGDIRPSLVAKSILSVLDEDDFELDYYKMMIFFMLETMTYANDAGIAGQLPESKEFEAKDLSNALQIKMTENDKVYIDDTEIAIPNLRKSVQNYIKTKASDGVIVVAASRETPYATYIAVQNEIVGAFHRLWDQLAQERFSKSMDELTEAQQQEIKAVYPMNLVESP